MDVQILKYTFQPVEDSYEPMIVLRTKITSKAGHRFPDGWPSKNRAVLDVSVEDQSKKKIFEITKIYMPQSTDSLDSVMVLGPEKKLGLIRDTSIQPFAPREESFEIPVPNDVKGVNVTVQLSYQPRPGDVYPIHLVNRSISFQ